MSWSPQINFRLRDDQMTFGDLIIDKNGAQILANMLVSIKRGEVPDIGSMKDILDQYAFTDQEFEKIKTDMDEIKKDIEEFKKIGSNGLQKWNVFMQTVQINASYIVGSDTWIERYKELKMIGANLYDQIVRCGYKFDAEKEKVYQERYGEVLGCTNSMERVSGVFERKYREDLINGNPDALDNFLDSMVEAGVWTREAAERERLKRRSNQLLNEGEGMKKYKDTLDAKKAKLAEEERQKQEREQRKADTIASEDKYVEVTYEKLQEWNSIVNNSDAYSYGPSAVLNAQQAFVNILHKVDKECGGTVNVDTTLPLTTQYNVLWNTYSMQSMSGAIEMAAIMIPENELKPIAAVMDTASNIDTQAIAAMVEEQTGRHTITATDILDLNERILGIENINLQNEMLGVFARILMETANQVQSSMVKIYGDSAVDDIDFEYHDYYANLAYNISHNNLSKRDDVDAFIEALIVFGKLDLVDQAQAEIDKSLIDKIVKASDGDADDIKPAQQNNNPVQPIHGTSSSNKKTKIDFDTFVSLWRKVQELIPDYKVTGYKCFYEVCMQLMEGIRNYASYGGVDSQQDNFLQGLLLYLNDYNFERNANEVYLNDIVNYLTNDINKFWWDKCSVEVDSEPVDKIYDRAIVKSTRPMNQQPANNQSTVSEDVITHKMINSWWLKFNNLKKSVDSSEAAHAFELVIREFVSKLFEQVNYRTNEYTDSLYTCVYNYSHFSGYDYLRRILPAASSLTGMEFLDEAQIAVSRDLIEKLDLALGDGIHFNTSENQSQSQPIRQESQSEQSVNSERTVNIAYNNFTAWLGWLDTDIVRNATSIDIITRQTLLSAVNNAVWQAAYQIWKHTMQTKCQLYPVYGADSRTTVQIDGQQFAVEFPNDKCMQYCFRIAQIQEMEVPTVDGVKSFILTLFDDTCQEYWSEVQLTVLEKHAVRANNAYAELCKIS